MLVTIVLIIVFIILFFARTRKEASKEIEYLKLGVKTEKRGHNTYCIMMWNEVYFNSREEDAFCELSDDNEWSVGRDYVEKIESFNEMEILTHFATRGWILCERPHTETKNDEINYKAMFWREKR